MGYATSIAEAIARMGNARAQGELQKGAIYGNMAQNLGQIPMQTMQFAEGMQSANQNQQMRKLQIESAQREAEFEKQAMAIVNDPSLTPQMKDVQMENLLRQHPDKWERYQNSREIRLLREQAAAEHLNKSRESMPGTVAPAEGFALPEPTTGKTVPGGGVANAFAPVTPRAEQLVHPPIPSPIGGPPLNALTRYQIRGEKQEDLEATAGRKLEQDKELAKYKQGLKPTTTGKTVERTVDLGDTVEYIYTDGTRETKPKGVSPSARFAAENRERDKTGKDKTITAAQVNTILRRMNTQLNKLHSDYSLSNPTATIKAEERGQGMGQLRMEEQRIREEAQSELAAYGITLEEAQAKQGNAATQIKSKAAPAAPAAPTRKYTPEELIQQGYKRVNGGWARP